MSLRVALHHVTRYQYDRPVKLSPHEVRLRPAVHTRTPILSYSLTVKPAQHHVNWQQDPYGNHVARCVFPVPTQELEFVVDLVADMTVINPFDFFIEKSAERWPFDYADGPRRELAQYLEPEDVQGALVDDTVQQIRAHWSGRNPGTIDFIVDVNARLRQTVQYRVRMEPGVQTPEHTMELGSGSCRDSAWLLAQVLRRLGLATRFVSGYLIQLTADQPPLDGPAGAERDFTDLHAWTEVYLPGAGWIGLDPTSGLFAGEGHIPLACAARPTSAAPVLGSSEVAGVEFSHRMSVQRVHEDPRVARPFAPRQWERILALGEALDHRINGLDLRLSMGSELSFVPLDGRGQARWALPEARDERSLAAARLLDRLQSPADPLPSGLRVEARNGFVQLSLPPVGGWCELVQLTETVYARARECGLGAERFLLDGCHTGTGAGNPLTLGGATAADSPLLRRPDLLESLIGCWQNHPSLSFLFSGTFGGSRGRAPRVDELRDDNLYELEIALQQLRASLPHAGIETTGPLVDGLLHNLLSSLDGSADGAEFSLDRYWSDVPGGKRGLLGLNGFEMAPHPRMSLVRALLLRALVLHFWQKPWNGRLVHWGTALHDRWMLPHFIEQDIRQLCRELRDAGIGFQDEWLAPFFEFRFPRYGAVELDGVRMELRQAIEPWPTAATAGRRHVDTTVQRLQLRVQGLTERRHCVCCNGRVLPLQPTGVTGQYVVGVRFRASAPAATEQLAMPVQAPLRFDLVDRWAERSLGGCVFHLTQADGRGHGAPPVNAREAEARRMARFRDIGHTPGPMVVADEPPNPSFPATLDLRWKV